MEIPSVELFKALAEEMNRDLERFKHLGFIDCRCVMAIEEDETLPAPKYYGLTFDTYNCIDVREVKSPDEYQPDFVIHGPAAAWREMFENIAANGKADLGHTINRLTMAMIPMYVTGADVVEKERFFRYNQSLQEFLNGYAKVAKKETATA